jgi:hypothetical protein
MRTESSFLIRIFLCRRGEAGERPDGGGELGVAGKRKGVGGGEGHGRRAKARSADFVAGRPVPLRNME